VPSRETSLNNYRFSDSVELFAMPLHISAGKMTSELASIYQSGGLSNMPALYKSILNTDSKVKE
jgi:hypothetical protein